MKKPSDAERRKKNCGVEKKGSLIGRPDILTGEVNTEISSHNGKEGSYGKKAGFLLWLPYKFT